MRCAKFSQRVDLSVVIVNWNSGRFLARLIHSLNPLKENLRDILVVDNGSIDGSQEVARITEGIQLLELDDNLGFPAAANRAVQLAKSPFVLLLNPDCEVNVETIAELYSRAVEHEKAGVLTGALFDQDGRSQYEFQIRRFPTFRSVISDSLFLDELRVSLLGPRSVDPPNQVTSVDQPAAAFWMFRTKAWSEIGGFDEQFFPAWFEDVDFCKRLKKAGWDILYFPNLPITHRGGLAKDQLGYRGFVMIYYANLLRYWKKHHRVTLPLVWLAVNLGILLRLLFGSR